MSNLGDYYSGCTVFDIFTTVDTQGRPTTLAGNPAPFLVVYKDAFAIGGYCTVIGAVLARDCNGLLGVNAWSVATNQSATFYACGHDYQVLLIGGCVDSLCVSGYVVGRFSLKNRAVLRPTVHARDLDVSAAGEAGLDWANIGSPTTAVGLSCTTMFSVQSIVNTVGVPACTAIFSVQSVLNSVNIPACTTIFSVTSVLNDVNAVPRGLTEQGVACTVWNSLQANYDVCGSFGVLLDCRTSQALQPSVPDRRLDVSTTGEAGLDWANIGSPTTAQNLSGTSTKAVEPTVAGRTLDVTATGAAGVDWGNVENKTTANDLDCTTLFKIHSVDNAIRADSCSAIFSVQRIVDPDTILDKGIAEPAAVFSWPGSLRAILAWLGAVASNQIKQEAGQQGVCDRGVTTTIARANTTDDGTTATRGSFT